MTKSTNHRILPSSTTTVKLRPGPATSTPIAETLGQSSTLLTSSKYSAAISTGDSPSSSLGSSFSTIVNPLSTPVEEGGSTKPKNTKTSSGTVAGIVIGVVAGGAAYM
ncbi:hypothetical protein IFR05_016545, partial [Cadophora sp. M221]